MDINLNNLNAITYDGHDVQTLVLNGTTLWIKPSSGSTPTYTAVSCITNSNTIQKAWYRQYFNTGIYTNVTSGTWEINMKIATKGNEGNVCIGHKGSSTPGTSDNDNRDFRLFFENYLFVDVGNGRSYSSSYSTSNLTNVWKEFTWTINWTNKSFTLKYKDSNYNIYSSTFSSYPNNCPVFIATTPMKFNYCNIKQDGVLIFDGVAAIDSNSIPCIYDSVSNSLIYAEGAWASDVIYEA